MQFKYGVDLADWQEEMIRKWNEDSYTAEDIAEVIASQKNLYITVGRYIAPSNLIIRQYCIEDLYLHTPKHLKEISHLYEILSDYPQSDIWLENYSYWRYMREALDSYIEYFSKWDKVPEVINGIGYLGYSRFQTYAAFLRASYKNAKGDKCYPAPYGDLRFVEIENEFNLFKSTFYPQHNYSIQPSFLEIHDLLHSIKYVVKPIPRGLNSHVPHSKRHIVDVIYNADETSFTVQNFKFYTERNSVKHWFSPYLNWRGWLSILQGKTL